MHVLMYELSIFTLGLGCGMLLAAGIAHILSGRNERQTKGTNEN